MSKFEGIMPALVTPLREDESIHVSVLRDMITYLIREGADGFYIGGATGEGLALRTEERLVLAEEAVKAIQGRKPCIIQVAAMDFRDALTLAKHAEVCGADGISATPPVFFQYDEDDVYNYYKALADAVHIPVMVYYNRAAGFPMDARFAARLFQVDNITAIKWTSSSYDEMIRLKDLTHGEMNVINGPDEMLLMGLNAGADGGIGTTYNFQLSNMKAVYSYFKAGDIPEAMEAQRRANRIIDAMKGYMAIPAAKCMMEAMGFAVGPAAFPMKRFTEAEKRQIVAAIKNAGWRSP